MAALRKVRSRLGCTTHCVFETAQMAWTSASNIQQSHRQNIPSGQNRRKEEVRKAKNNMVGGDARMLKCWKLDTAQKKK